MQKEIYDNTVKIQEKNWWYKTRRDIITDLLRDEFPAGQNRRVLSVGCGVGWEMKFISRYGEAYGIDPSPTAIEYCKEAGISKNLFVSGAEKLQFEDTFFDAVFILDVLEHVERDEAALTEIYRVLKPGGILVLTVPAFPLLWTKSDVRAHHFRRYTRSSLKQEIEKSGFRIKRLSYFNMILLPLIGGIKLLTRFYEPAFVEGKEVSQPNPVVNWMLYHIFKLEVSWLARFNLPLGISLLAIARKETK